MKLRLATLTERATVIVPHPRRQISVGTFGSILKQAGLSLLEFEDLL
ncbi:MAG: type II toxin-antitoxin system HicA family toxin [Tepidiformaceae bacterium]